MDDVFAARLREARGIRGLTQSGLANAAGLPATTISHFENGSRKPSFENLRRLNQALGVSADYLLGVTDDRNMAMAANRIARHLGSASESDLAMLEAFAETIAKRKVLQKK